MIRHSCTIVLLLAVIFVTPVFAQEIGWQTMEEITARIVPPIFPARDFPITEFGAIGDGSADCSEAFTRAIAVCAAAGGGRVVVPPGIYLTGPIHLKSNVNLHLKKNSVVKFSTDPDRYLPVVFTRWEGVEVMNYSPLIYAFEQENIAVTGEGVLDGQGSNEHWWPWKGKSDDGGWKKGMPHQKPARDSLFAMAERGVPVHERRFGKNSYLRPSFFQPYRSKNILVQGVTFKNSPMWFLNPVLCQNVTFDGVTVQGLGPNNDGCNPESSRDVLITGCYFDTGDDCIAIKSGRNNDGRRVNVPSENIVIRRSKMKEGHGGVVFGSELSGSIRNVFVEDCEMDSPNLDRALRFKTNSVRGGIIENVFARRITVGEVKEAVLLVDFNYEEGDAGAYTPTLRNVFISEVTAKKGKYAIFAKGYERSPISNIVLENCTFDGMNKPNVVEHVKDLTMKNVRINGMVMDTP